MPGQHRCAAAAGNGDLQWAALDDGGHLEAGQFRIVHDIGEQMARLGRGGDGLIDVAVVGGGDHQPGIGQPRDIEASGDPVDPALLVPGPQARGQFRRADAGAGAGMQQRLGLPLRHRATAHDQYPAALQVGEQGKQRSAHGRVGVVAGLSTVLPAQDGRK